MSTICIKLEYLTPPLRQNSIKENDLVTNQKTIHLDERTWQAISNCHYDVFIVDSK